MMYRLTIIAALLFIVPALYAQSLWPWPVTPFNSAQEITGNFSEYRDTSTNGHFHNGTDIPKADGSPVFPSKDGVIISMDPNGSSAFVRVNDLAYVHIFPNQSLSIGDSVFASQTVLGTILPGLGHVHLTNGTVGFERNSSLPGSGLTPYNDPWPPIIRFVRFFQNNTDNELQPQNLSGLVDILVKVDEQNGPPGAATSRLNNGTYKIGYKIYQADSTTLVYSPPNNGVRFQFDIKYNNNFVNTVYKRNLSSTTSHTYQVTNDISGDNFWNSGAIPDSNYVVLVFTQDTRGNTDSSWVAVRTTEADLVPPAKPAMRLAREVAGGLQLAWEPNSEPDLLGYRLYFSFDNVTWSLFRDENSLTPANTDTVLNQILSQDVYFRLTAVDDAPLPNESVFSDVYGLSNGLSTPKVLIVNGFDRINGGWTQPWHSFVFDYGRRVLQEGYSFDSAPNESIADGSILSGDYDAVFWFTGDESSSGETFSSSEQSAVAAYLENGGKLFVTGSRIAWDLDPASGGGANTDDQFFLNTFLKSSYVASEAGGSTLGGVTGSLFDGLSVPFGQRSYAVDEADAVSPSDAATLPALSFASGNTAAVQFEGSFGSGTGSGKLIYLAVPWETIEVSAANALLNRVLTHFFGTTGIGDPIAESGLPQEFRLLPNYPNPFNPATTLEYHLPKSALVHLEVYNTLGQQVRRLLNDRQPAGVHRLVWDGRDNSGRQLPSGVYILSLRAGDTQTGSFFRAAQKMMMLK